ncbi:unnamed protein product [Caenorhabditis angaria]|uniref:WD repeat-containing protein 60 n=1 Tax=Caenorhabditis angaria TaxID=860376 RepID=A0A9P1N2G3_9PELO|nr:unnamed protein product [Caenorhabditis angaria]
MDITVYIMYEKVEYEKPEYEDDFEDYEDDFEEDDDVEKEEEKQNAIGESPADIKNNEPGYESEIMRRLSKTKEGPAKIQEKPQPIAPQITFSAINNTPYTHYNEEERKSVETRAFERLQKLRGLISIETSKSVVFTDLSSNIFEPIQSISSNSANAFTQTGQDSKNIEIQTEIGDVEDKEMQFPHIEESFIKHDLDREKTPEDRQRFKKFFFAATQTIREILISSDKINEEEEIREKSILKFSRGFNSYHFGTITEKHIASCIRLGEPDSILVAFEIFGSPAQDLLNKSLIVEFYIHRKRPPKRLFVVESVVVDMFLSVTTNILYVCLKDGTLCAFDTSISDASLDDFLPWTESQNDIALRRPSFDSSFLATTISDASPIIGMSIIKSQVGEEITTIDATGTVAYWQSTRHTNNKNEINIQLSAVIRPHPILKRHSTSFAISAFCQTEKPVRFFMGTDTGILYSMYKSDTSQAMPKIYKTEKEKYGEITGLAANPVENSVILVGFSSGSVAIYRTSQSSPIIQLIRNDYSTRAINVMWSRFNPSAFYVIHGEKTIVTWDLSHSTTARWIDQLPEHGAILSTCTWKSDISTLTFMGISSDTGNVEMHVLENPNPKNKGESILSVLNRVKNI